MLVCAHVCILTALVLPFPLPGTQLFRCDAEQFFSNQHSVCVSLCIQQFRQSSGSLAENYHTLA